MLNSNKRCHLRFLSAVILGLAVSACNSTDPTLGVDPSADVAAPSPAAVAAATGTAPAAGVSNPVSTTAQSRVYFAPVVGAPVAQVTALSRRLSAAAAANNVKLEPSSSTSIDNEIRGYFSALSEGGATTVIHVWDIFSPQGQRVHRIQGQEEIAGTGTDPWAIVPAATMERIADTVLSQYTLWRSTS